LVEVALGNTIVTRASMHEFPFNFAFVAGDQPYYIPQYSIGFSL
jgi:hypothetical protein